MNTCKIGVTRQLVPYFNNTITSSEFIDSTSIMDISLKIYLLTVKTYYSIQCAIFSGWRSGCLWGWEASRVV